MMDPVPARIAAAPSPKSRPSCNPAVPPPPVTGAALGTLLTAGATVIVAVAVAVAVPGTGVVVSTVGVPGDAVPSEAGVVPVAGTVAVVFTDGEKVGTVGVEDEPEQAETVIGASRVSAPQQRTVILALIAVPAIVTRTFMEPSSCARR
jgi:hypothetical protein